MKKSIALVAFLGSALFSGVAFGQTKAASQMSVDLTVNLHPMISIQIDGSNIVDNTGEILTSDGKQFEGGKVTEGTPVDSKSEVVIDYKTANDYLNGKGTMKKNHLKLFSTGIYEVAVKADDLVTDAGKTMGANNFKIEAFDAVSGSPKGTVTLANIDGILISGVAGKEQILAIANNNGIKLEESTF